MANHGQRGMETLQYNFLSRTGSLWYWATESLRVNWALGVGLVQPRPKTIKCKLNKWCKLHLHSQISHLRNMDPKDAALCTPVQFLSSSLQMLT
jgi:hypothetical protein